MKTGSLAKHIYFLMAFAILIQACETKELASDEYEITANISGLAGGKAQLARLDLVTNEPEIIDSARIIDGKFTFTGSLENPYVHTIIINDSVGKIQLFLENSRLDINGDIGNLDQVTVTGSREDSLFRSYPTDSIFARDTGMEIMLTYPEYTFSAFVAYYQFQIFNIQLDTMEYIVGNFREPVKSSVYYRHLVRLYKTIKRVAISQPAPSFILPNINGDSVKLSDFKGKYVLIDFWASWCAPCRAANPTLVKTYNELKNRDFTIVSISVDKNRELWLKAIEKDGLIWPNLSTVSGWDEVSDAYGVKAVPQNFLIDPQGIIIDKNIKEDILYDKLDRILPKS